MRGNALKRVVIVGSGIVGTSTAYALAKRGVDVRVFDRKEEGRATDAAAGIIAPWMSLRRNKPWYRLARLGAAYYPKLVDELHEHGEVDVGFAQNGAIKLHDEHRRSEKTFARAEERLEEAPEMGTLRRLTVEEVTERFPALAPNEYHGVEVTGGGRVDGHELLRSLVRVSKSFGVRFEEENVVLRNNEGAIEVLVQGEVVPYDELVIATGAWAKETFATIGIDFPVEGQKAQIIHLKEHEPHRYPVLMPPGNHYIAPLDDRIVVGATHEDDREYDMRVTAGGVREVLQKALDVAPGLSDCEVMDIKIGYRPHTLNKATVFGRVLPYEHIYTANGLGASGLTVGPFVGEQLAKCIVGEPLDVPAEDYAIEQMFKMH